VVALGGGCSGKGRQKKHAKRQPPTTEVPSDLRRMSPGAPTSSSTGARCPSISAGVAVGRVAERALDEASGLVVSRKNKGVFWSHNDAGGGPKLYAMTEAGRALGTYQLTTAKLEDWEDIAVASDGSPNGWHLYVADIGTNAKARHRITIYRVAEPDVALEAPTRKNRLDHVERFDFEYPGQLTYDAETLLVDPKSLELFIVTKPRSEPPKVFRAKPPLDASHSTRLEEVLELSIFDQGKKRSTLVTAGDVSPDGSWILIRTYTTAFLWRREGEESLVAALARTPCSAALAKESQGETIAFSPDGSAYYTLSEGRNPSLFRFRLGD
jgi:hypothetical protein